MLSLEDVLEALPLFEDEEVSLKYSKEARRKGAGFRYEELVIALVFLRCLRKRLPDFKLTSDNGYAGKFDDVVVTWSGNKARYAFLVQLKHKTSRELEEIKKGQLFSPSDNNKSDFKIWKYHESFRSFKNNLSGLQYALVISTNVSLHDNALGYFRERQTNSVLGTELIDTGGRVYALDTKEVRCDTDFMEHFFIFCSQKGVNELKRDICVELEHLLGPSDSHDRLCEELCRCVMEWKDTPIESRDILSGSWNKWKDIVRQHNMSKVTDYGGLTTQQKFHNVENVWQDTESTDMRPLSADTVEWEAMPSNIRDRLNSSWKRWQDTECQQAVSKLTDCNGFTTRLKFRNVEIVRQHVESSNPAFVRPLADDTMALTATKVHQAIYPERHILMNIERFRESQQTVLRWWGPFCRWLVLIDDNAEERRQCSNLLNKLRGQLEDGRRLIVVSPRAGTSFQDSFRFGDVSDGSWDDLLLTKIRLNGDKHNCQLGDLVSSTAELQTLLEHRLSCLVALARMSGCVQLGQTLGPLPANYIPRQLVTRRYVKDEFFSSLAVRDVCIMDNSTCQKLLDELSYLMKNYKVCTLDDLEGCLASYTSMPILAKVERTDTIALESICKKFKGLRMYIVKHTRRGWDVQNFRAGSGRIRRYVREQAVQLLESLDVLKNKVIVEGRPGVGKSTLLLDLAREVKENNPSSWVVQINLRECFQMFEKHMSGRKIGELILQSVVSNEGELAGLEFSLLQYCLKKHRRMVCLVDSFDEVCPDYAEEFLEALRLLSPSRGKLVVTTRPAVARLLEDHFGSLAHLLPTFSDIQLHKYFEQLRPRMPRLRIDGLATSLKDLFRIPLFAEMYRELMEVGTGSHDTVTLYETFFHYKFGKMYVEKFGENVSAPGKRKEVKKLWKFHEAHLKHLAGTHLVQHDEIFQQCMRVSGYDSFLIPGIVHWVNGRKLLFEHRTFGEYFLAKWCFLDAGQKACASLYSSAHSGRSLEFFLEVFDRMASRGRPLLGAVLDGDERRVRALLQAGVGLSERDVWGRSALHLAAAQGVEPSLLRLLCDRMKTVLAEEDALLHWTPLQYAAKRGHWGTVEALLQAGAGLNHLGNIQEARSGCFSAGDPDYVIR